MRYIPESIGETFARLEVEQVYIIGEHNLIQWHKGDYTIVAQAEYDIIGTYEAEAGMFQVWATNETTANVEAEQLDVLVQAVAERDGSVEFICEERSRFYAVRKFEILEVQQAFSEEVINLRKAFIDCMVGLEDGQEGTERHISLVRRFQVEFEGFLDRYKQQSAGTFAAYVAELGVEHAQALRDVIRITNLYE